MKKYMAQDIVELGKTDDTFLSNNGVKIDIVSVRNDDGSQERRYKRSYPDSSAPISKALFLEFFNFKTFTKNDIPPKQTKPETEKKPA